MSKPFASSRSKLLKKRWSDLPHDLLSLISEGLRLIDLLGFRGVCKDWRSASSKASAQIASAEPEAWFLMYGAQCSLINNHDKRFTISIPEMVGATCLASLEGWLLLFCRGSMFFFCPFSRAKIELPQCPFSELSNHAPAFSSAPTHQDCTIAVIKRANEFNLELHLLRRGDNQWTRHECHCLPSDLGPIMSAAYHEGAFHFLDGSDGLVIFDAETKRWAKYVTVPVLSFEKNDEALNYNIRIYKHRFEYKFHIREILGIEEPFSISVCGAMIPQTNNNDIVIQCESINAGEGCERRKLKGVWIQPRFYKISPHQSW